MKFISLIITIIVASIIIYGCHQNYDNIKNITIIIDPNKMENKYQVINIIKRDSIAIFMDKLNNRKRELRIFIPRFAIEIDYFDNKKEEYQGSGNYIEDAKGHTYILLAKDWDIFNY